MDNNNLHGIPLRGGIDFVIKTLEDICINWKGSALEQLLKEVWLRKQMQIDLSCDNPINNMPIVSRRDSFIKFGIYQRISPDRDLQLAVAIVKSINGEYDNLINFKDLDYQGYPELISETECCTIFARKLLSMRGN